MEDLSKCLFFSLKKSVLPPKFLTSTTLEKISICKNLIIIQPEEVTFSYTKLQYSFPFLFI